MARFDKADDALQAIKHIQNEFSAINAVRANNNTGEIKFGSGLSAGKVLLANFGSQHKIDRTIIGDVVNRASRIEGLTKKFKVEVLFDETIHSLVSDRSFIRFIGSSKVQGRENTVDLYEYYGHNSEAVRAIKSSTSIFISKIWELINTDQLSSKKINEEIAKMTISKNLEEITTCDPVLLSTIEYSKNLLNRNGQEYKEVS